jgi:hypothetical protein
VVTSSSGLASWSVRSGVRVGAAEVAWRQGVRPIASTDELVNLGAFTSDEELDEFLADLYSSRRFGVA